MCTLEKIGNVFVLTITGADDHRLHPNLIDSIRDSLAHAKSEYESLARAKTESSSSSSFSSALITTAEGKFFSNGYDLAWALQDRSTRAKHMSRKLRALIGDLIDFPMPTIAAVTGHASAAGFVLALAHDYVVMRSDRGFLYMSELDIGFPIPRWFSELVKYRVGSPVARREIVLKAARITADVAVRMGIVDSAHGSAQETVDAAVKLGEELASRKWDGNVYAQCRKTLCFDLQRALSSDETVGDYGDEEPSKTLSKL